MNIWQFKPTEVVGVVELGLVDNLGELRDEENLQMLNSYSAYYGTRHDIEEAMASLGFSFTDRNHFFNPQLYTKKDGPLYWHTDTDSGRECGADMLIMLACQNPNAGTLISGPLGLKPYKTRLQLQPWVVYYVRGDIVHRSPLVESRSPRLLYRWYQSGKHIDDNSRRDNDGNFIYKRK